MLRPAVVLIFLAIAFAGPASEALAGKKAGPEFPVNTSGTGHQTNPSVAGLAKRRFVVTWAAEPGHDGFGSGVFGRYYEANGKPKGEEFQVNTTAKEDQYGPSVAGLTNGGFVVTWTSLHDIASFSDVLGQRYSARGMPIGEEFRVNSRKQGHQNTSNVASLNNGGFVVIWQSHGQDGDGYGIYGQRYNAKGKPKGEEFRVNRTTKSDQWVAAVAALNDGGFAVVWGAYGQDGDRGGIYGQRYDAKGKRRGKEFRVNNTTVGTQDNPSVAGLAKGGFVVAWSSENLDGSETGVAARRYSAKGKPRGRETTVNTYKKLGQGHPVVAALAKGGYVVTWMSEDQDDVDDQSVDLNGVYGQRFKASGKRSGKEFAVPTFKKGSQRQPSIVGLSRGNRFVVTWESDGQDNGGYNIYGQRFDK